MYAGVCWRQHEAKFCVASSLSAACVRRPQIFSPSDAFGIARLRLFDDANRNDADISSYDAIVLVYGPSSTADGQIFL